MGKFHSKQGELEVCKVDVKLALHKSWHVCEVEMTSFHVKNPNFELFSVFLQCCFCDCATLVIHSINKLIYIHI